MTEMQNIGLGLVLGPGALLWLIWCVWLIADKDKPVLGLSVLLCPAVLAGLAMLIFGGK